MYRKEPHFDKSLETVQELYQQQLWMYENEKHSIAQRIVSLSQPHIRPIVRGEYEGDN